MIRLLRYDLVGFLIASRIPSLLIIGATQYFTAIFLMDDYAAKTADLGSLQFLLFVCSTVFIAAAGYINNDYYDQKIDLVNRPDRVVVGTIFRRRLAILAHLVLTLAGIGLGFMLKTEIGLIHIFSSSLLWYYSNRLRRIPLFGNMVIAGTTALVLLLVPIYLGRNEPIVFVYALFAASIVWIREIIKDLIDMKGDQQFGVQSVPVMWGVRGAKLFIGLIILMSISFLISFLIVIDNWFLQTYFISLVPVFAWFIFRLVMADQQRSYIQLQTLTNVIIFTGLVSMLFLKF